ncbi:putative pentatricopeptide repeat-containing protein [Acorus gramineus]|uniref:Pentatricopeptide repeat-containing protein n=1 Tax=Acorus gramineus TaxID=55184 RepID=A0AAV9AUC6_ACOGR|nr:putative pentatricopeptide repeat-containing protein [Acorus gramineus]
MSHKDPSRLNILISKCVRKGDLDKAWLRFRSMHASDVRIDGFTFTPILGACAALPGGGDRGRQLHALLIKTGCVSGPIVDTALLDMYSKCGRLGDAVRVFDEMRSRDLVAHNALLSGFVKHGFAREAIEAFRSMVVDRVRPSEFTLSTVLKACSSLDALALGEQVHARTIVDGCKSIVLNTTLIDFYSNCGRIGYAISVFDGLDPDCKKDEAIDNALISGFVRNGLYEDAFSMLRAMKRPNRRALASAISACSESLNLRYGKQLHCVIARNGFDEEIILRNALLDMYAKCGELKSAQTVFDTNREKNVISWTTIIDAYRRCGRGFEAVKLFKEMESSPNSVTFLAILSACAHSGLVKEGLDCFVAMGEYGLKPSPDHYACLIDLLGRAGRIEEAWDVINSMMARDIEPTEAVWAAMMNICRLNVVADKGVLVAKLLSELEKKSGNYTSISNFYAAIEHWGDVEELRKVMNEKGLRKDIGGSWVAVEV